MSDSQKQLQKEFDDDRRDVADLWKAALKSYKGIVGVDLERKFNNTEDMIAFGVKEMNNFHKFRHNGKKVDKLRTLFMANIEYVEQGAQQLVSAATPAFPPAAAIGTAVTFMLTACRQVSADYDIVVVFFEDMNAFLKRIVILETRMPANKAYQNCLMEVFTSFLVMCGISQKYIELGRFKKWIQNLLNGEDGELGSGRKDMDVKLNRLQSATEFAILGNTEELKTMNAELSQNQQQHLDLLKQQQQSLGSIQDTTEHIRSDMAKLLRAFDEQRKESGKDQKPKHSAAAMDKPASARRIRNILPVVEGEIHEYYILKETLVDDTGSWLFAEPSWSEWLDDNNGFQKILGITGRSGMGKSHLAAAMYDKLWKQAAEDSEKTTCVAHFYFREQHQSLSSFLNCIITVINQVVEQHARVCEIINAEYQKDIVAIHFHKWRELVNKMLAPCFLKDSKFRLLLVLDGIDELNFLTSFTDFINIIKERGLRINVVFTSRPEVVPEISKVTDVTNIEVTKDKQTKDLKALIWKQLNSMEHLRGFGKYVKQRISDTVQAQSPNVLYAEHMLVQFNSIGREGAVLRNLGQPMPPTLYDLYESELETCHRRTPRSRRELVTTLIHWVAFSFTRLTLDQITALLRHLTLDPKFEIEEIPEPFDKFIRIGDAGADAEQNAIMASQGGWGTDIKDLENPLNPTDPDRVYNDGALLIKFRERSMRSFFRDAGTSENGFHWSTSKAHRSMFLTIAEIARPISADNPKWVDKNIIEYGQPFLFQHWKQINPEEHSPEENAAVMTALWELLSNQGSFVTLLEGKDFSYFETFTAETFDKIASWAKLLGSAESHLKEEVQQWWKKLSDDPRDCLDALIKGHVAKVFAAANVAAGDESFSMAKDAAQVAKKQAMFTAQAEKNFPDAAIIKDEPDSYKTAVLGLAGLFEDLEMSCNAHCIVGELLLQYKQREAAEVICLKGLELAGEDVVGKLSALNLLAQIQMKRGKLKKAWGTVEAFNSLLTDEKAPKALKQAALTTKARAQAKRKDKSGAAETYAAYRLVDPSSVTPVHILNEELELWEEDDEMTTFVDTLKRWTPIERLTWMCSDYDESGRERSMRFRDAAVLAGDKDFIVEAYEEAIRYLDNVNAGAPLRIELARTYIEVREDYEMARQLLDEVFDSSSAGWPYAVTDTSPGTIVEDVVNQQAVVLHELFRRSRSAKDKSEMLAATEGLLTRPLLLDVPPETGTWLLPYRVQIASMTKKIGSPLEFQRQLQDIIDKCVEGLSDVVGWNDSVNLAILHKALVLLSELTGHEKLRKVADIMASARFSQLATDLQDDLLAAGASGEHEDDGWIDDEEEDDDDDDTDESECSDGSEDGNADDTPSENGSNGGDEEEEEAPGDEGDLLGEDGVLGCEGFCQPTALFTRWDKRVAYQCLTCDLFLCEDCYEARQADNRGEKPLPCRQFCGRDHSYSKGPMEGWRGVSEGKVRLEGEEPIEFSEILRQVKSELCKEAWEEYWRGG